MFSIRLRSLAALCSCALALSTPVLAQASKDGAKSSKKKDADKTPKADGIVSKFFQRDEWITATLTTNLKRIKGDKAADAPWRAAKWTYAAVAPDTGTVTIPARIRTRGIWRLKNCEFPPVRINFRNEDVKGTLFKGLDEPKLVNFCRDNDDYEQYILQEFQLYRIYRLITPVSHAVRLLRLTYADSATAKAEVTRWAFIVEDPAAIADRVGGKMLKIKGAGPSDLEPVQSTIVAMFLYMIGNTDFSVSGLHNAEVLGMPFGDYYPIVYDFDFSGAVNARYATVDKSLPIKRVRDRLYRGYCVPADVYPEVAQRFNAKKDSIYALYRDPIGQLLKPDIVTETLKYFDEFYKTLNDPKLFKRDVVNECAGKK
jgi:hypothetical protein